MGKEEEKPVLGYPRSDQFYQTESQFYHQSDPHFHQIPHSAAYAQPCPGYPNHPSAHQSFQYYDYGYPAKVPLPYVSPDVDQGFSFGRVMLCLMCFLVLFVLIMSMFTFAIFMTLKPTFKLESFAVRTFEISGDGGPGTTTLKANWESKVSVHNTNHRSSVLVKHAETTLVYRYVVLDTSSVDHVEIQKESSVDLMDAFSYPNSKRSYNGESVVSEIAKDREKGRISFDLKLDVQVVVKSRVFQKSEKMRLFCEKITLNFQNNSSNIPIWDGSKLDCVSGF